MSKRRKRIFVDTSKIHKKKSKADQALTIAKKVDKKQKRSVEYVLGKTTISTDAFNATPVDDHLTEGLAGEDFKVRMTSLSIKGTIKRNTTSVLVDDYRIDVVLDKNPQGAVATALEVYGSATPVIGAHKNPLQKGRFKVLRSKFGVLDDSGPSGVSINWYIKLNLMCVTKVSDNYAIANLLKNSIMLFYWTTASANQPIPALVTNITVEHE